MRACLVGLTVLALSVSACGKGEPTPEPAAAAAAAAGSAPAPSREEPTIAVPTAADLKVRAGTGSAAAARRFLTWTPVHAFLGAPVVGGSVVSNREAIVFTKDNHVGVTSDAGTSWGFVRQVNGVVRSVAGAPGGPFVVAGPGGYMAISTDGKSWRDLPRYTAQELVAVAVGERGIAAIGRLGAFVSADKQGNNVSVSNLPDKFKPYAISLTGGKIIVYAGKKGYESADGTTWTPTASIPAGGGKQWATSRGLCSVGKVGKRRGVVCSIGGTAYGLSPTEVVVVGKGWLATTNSGGARWAMAPLPLKAIKGVAGTRGGPYHVYDAKSAIASSTDGGRTWNPTSDAAVLEGAPQFPKPGKCEGRLPAAGEACVLARQVTSPENIPDVFAASFRGDVGLAMGASALVAFTSDGGSKWNVSSGYALGSLVVFEMRGSRLVAVGSKQVAISKDAGKSFYTVDLPPKTPLLLAAHIDGDRAVYVAGRGGTILKSEGALDSWVKLNTGPKNKVDYVALHAIGDALYAAGSKGELHRSGDNGTSWTPLTLGVGEPVQKMAGQGSTVLALTMAGKWGGNKLLRSDDGGLHFVVQRELSERGGVADFEFKDGVIRHENLVSNDFGATWTKASDWYWAGSVDVADGSGIRLANVKSFSGKDRTYVVGTKRDDLTIVDSFFNKNALFFCGATSGCWMLAGGQVYRPRY